MNLRKEIKKAIGNPQWGSALKSIHEERLDRLESLLKSHIKRAVSRAAVKPVEEVYKEYGIK